MSKPIKGIETMMIVSDYPILSLVVGSLFGILLMYLARAQAHSVIQRCARLIYNQLRLLSRSCLQSTQRIRLRNHEVTKALAEALMERQLERRFMRIEKLVEKDLTNYQHLAADINRQLVAIDEDYVASAKVPEVSAEWVAAVDAIASLQDKERSSEVMNKILEDIHQTVQQHQRDALREHRWTVSSRHKVLSTLKPQWRKLTKMLEHIDNNIEILRLRLRQVDQHMGQFEMLTAGSGQGIMSSMLMRFVSALCFVAVGVGAAWINWQLLYQPLEAFLPPQAMGSISFSALIAGLHIAATVVAAAMISESLRITHYFPLVTAMTRRGRQSMTFVGVILLLSLAVLEAAALFGAPALAGVNAGVIAGAQWASLSQLMLIVLGVILPLMLSLIVIPLEYLLHTIRPVFGSALLLVMHFSALLLRMLGALSLQCGQLLLHGYDLVIFAPLWVERDLRSKKEVSVNQKTTAKELDSSLKADVKEVENITSLQFGSDRLQ